MTGWTSHTSDALARTPRGATPLHRDHWTLVSDSTTADGLGVFAVKKLPAAFVLYTYTGVQRTAAEASRRPNAYQLDLQTGNVCDASNNAAASPARYVNTRGSYAKDNNCVFKKHQGIVYLITTQDVGPFEELFAPYGIADELCPSWPLAFLGDPHSQVEDYKLYLQKPPAGEQFCLCWREVHGVHQRGTRCSSKHQIIIILIVRAHQQLHTTFICLCCSAASASRYVSIPPEYVALNDTATHRDQGL